MTTVTEYTNSGQIAEVQTIYKTKVKAADRVTVKGSRDAYAALKPAFEHLMEYREQFAILLLNRANKVLGWIAISEGGVSGTVADPKMIFQAALLTNASGIILSHNHPSGNTTPSGADKEMTKRIQAAGELLEIKVLDHVILTEAGFYSFADQGLM